MNCFDCPLCSDPEILTEFHYMKDKTYATTRIVNRCLASPHKYIIGSVVSKCYCKKRGDKE